MSHNAHHGPARQGPLVGWHCQRVLTTASYALEALQVAKADIQAMYALACQQPQRQSCNPCVLATKALSLCCNIRTTGLRQPIDSVHASLYWAVFLFSITLC